MFVISFYLLAAWVCKRARIQVRTHFCMFVICIHNVRTACPMHLFYCFKLDYMYTKYIRSMLHSWTDMSRLGERFVAFPSTFFPMTKNIDENVCRRWVNSICICIWLWYKSFQSNIVQVIHFFTCNNARFSKWLTKCRPFYWNSTKLHFWFAKVKIKCFWALNSRTSFCYYMYFMMLSFTKKVAMHDLHLTAIKHYRSNRLPLSRLMNELEKKSLKKRLHWNEILSI